MNRNAQQLLEQAGKSFRQSGNELITTCIFNGCDKDSRPNERHLYINEETGLFHCKKCDASGNLFKLAAALGLSEKSKMAHPKSKGFDSNLVEQFHSALPERVKGYLRSRGIEETVIKEKKIGYGTLYGREWITIPFRDEHSEYAGFRLRRDPDNETNGDKYMVYPRGTKAVLYGQEVLRGNDDYVVICEGELDCLTLLSKGVVAVTSTGGATTFKREWLQQLKGLKKIYVCFDRDDAGRKGSDKVSRMLVEGLPNTEVFVIELPERMHDGKDVTDYFNLYEGTVDELMLQLPRKIGGKKLVDVSSLEPITLTEVAEILGLTIKHDETNKVVTFVAMLSTYTEDSQLNVGFIAPSATGKSYIPMEVAKLFPREDVIQLAAASPQSFFHEAGKKDEKKNAIIVDLERKILIFLDQPNPSLLMRLRPFLSHDEKDMLTQFADKTSRFGMRTKKVIIRGFSSVFFCSAGQKMDEQEVTRFIVLSPEIDQEKFRASIKNTFAREANPDAYQTWLDEHPGRKELTQRIRAIKEAGIGHIRIENEKFLLDRFLQDKPLLKARHQRDSKRLAGLVKVCALLNLWWRERDGENLIANDDDIETALELWQELAVSQELNISPYLLDLYEQVIVPAWCELNEAALNNGSETHGVPRKNVMAKYAEIHGQALNGTKLRQDFLPILEQAGLIAEEPDPTDGRQKLILPLKLPDIVSDDGVQDEK